MRKAIILACCVCFVFGRPQGARDSYKDAVITKYEIDNDGSGNYKFAYDTSDGQSRQEEGELQNAGTDNEILVVRGSFSFVGLDGVTYTVNYIADENGFRPEGAHLPAPGRKTQIVEPPVLGFPAAALGSLVGGGLG